MMPALHQNHTKNLLPQNGELYYFENFLDNDKATMVCEAMLNNIAWQQRQITMFGKTVDQPRLISWHAHDGIEYVYSGIHMYPSAWTEELLEIKKLIETKLDYQFNSAFLNLYRHGGDYMGWHRDNEKSLGPEPCIASISLGADRKFRLKHIHNKLLNVDLTLNSGSLLIMSGEIQHFWKHCLPQSKKVKQPRINITYRYVIADE